ncbi:hypothetical protein ES288_A05G361800v1 [Gossypium darwinii]|uniref:Peptidase metallopeptidase domain-containing protein n=1 Tax=Gossypium darwinii TaxID=34276 RepID=A0A5D2GPT9_GOSDA|nr:hypothetical protein ES288_A05G361800v1 [Gossypium darwinii]
MKFQVLVIAIWVLVCFGSVSARFFPNITDIPSWIKNNATSKAPWDAFNKFAGCRPGEKREGLSQLKQYFNRFGYIPNSPSNFSEDFDDELENALKTYQQNFNLNVTGQLDNQTLQQIVRPRCGNADVINGTSSMNSGRSSSFHTTGHLHTTAHFTFFPGTPRWPSNRQDLTYSFLPANGLTDEVKAVFTSAFQKWSTVTPLTFTQVDSYSSADITIGFYTGDHGDGEPFDGASVSTAVDLESVAVHEIGHLLGLGHSSVEDAIMYPSITSRTRKVELADDDIQGIQLLYGTNPNYNGSTTSNTQERESSDGVPRYLGPRWGLALFLAVGFGSLFL